MSHNYISHFQIFFARFLNIHCDAHLIWSSAQIIGLSSFYYNNLKRHHYFLTPVVFQDIILKIQLCLDTQLCVDQKFKVSLKFNYIKICSTLFHTQGAEFKIWSLFIKEIVIHSLDWLEIRFGSLQLVINSRFFFSSSSKF